LLPTFPHGMQEFPSPCRLRSNLSRIRSNDELGRTRVRHVLNVFDHASHAAPDHEDASRRRAY
jgi:hypothetical protein